VKKKRRKGGDMFVTANKTKQDRGVFPPLEKKKRRLDEKLITGTPAEMRNQNRLD